MSARCFHILRDGIRRARVPSLPLAPLIGLEQAHPAVAAIQVPRLADADMLVQAVGAVLGQDADGIDPAVDTVAQRKVYDPKLTGKGHGRLGARFRKDSKASAFSTSQDHRYDFHINPLVD